MTRNNVVRCPACAELIPAGSVVCPECDEPLLSNHHTATSPNTKVCPFCGEQIKAKAIKCRFCSETLDDSQYATVKQMVAPGVAGSRPIPNAAKIATRDDVCKPSSASVQPGSVPSGGALSTAAAVPPDHGEAPQPTLAMPPAHASAANPPDLEPERSAIRRRGMGAVVATVLMVGVGIAVYAWVRSPEAPHKSERLDTPSSSSESETAGRSSEEERHTSPTSARSAPASAAGTHPKTSRTAAPRGETLQSRALPSDRQRDERQELEEQMDRLSGQLASARDDATRERLRARIKAEREKARQLAQGHRTTGRSESASTEPGTNSDDKVVTKPRSEGNSSRAPTRKHQPGQADVGGREGAAKDGQQPSPSRSRTTTAPPSPSPHDRVTYSNLLAMAKAAVDEGNIDLAVDLAMQAKQLIRADPAAYRLLADLMVKKNHQDLGKRYYREYRRLKREARDGQ